MPELVWDNERSRPELPKDDPLKAIREVYPPSPSSDLSLDQVFARLKSHKQVKGVLLLGSVTTDAFNPASDYDLVILLDLDDRPWFVGVTQIDHRLADLIFVSHEAAQKAACFDSSVEAPEELAPIRRWLKMGTIVHDPQGLLQAAQKTLRERDWKAVPSSRAAYGAWFAINYNLAQTRRLLSSPDPAYQGTAAVRMAVYGHSDVWFGYFTIRQMEWPGDKAAYRCLQREAPEFLEAYEEFIRAAEPKDKLAKYEKVTALAAKPYGGLWPVEITLTNLENKDMWAELMEQLPSQARK
jgi:predicted nucleotidyltransferase